jgi:hypothetical protein
MLIASVMTLLIAGGCDQSFDPRGPYVKRLVVYSVLSERSDSQYVRVYTTYNPSGFDPLENTSDTYVRNAKVTVTDDSTTYSFKEAVIPRDDKNRYASDLVAYLAYPCSARLEKRYSLAITSDQGNATATVTIPGKGYVYNNTPSIFIRPDSYTEDIPVSVGLSSAAQGYLVRLYVNFDVVSDESVVHKRLEVPSAMVSTASPQVQYTYATLTRRPAEAAYSYFNIFFSRAAYIQFQKDVIAQYGGFRLTSATFILTQVETNLYNYYSLANGFLDPYSVREDQPDYSNIVGGFGVFGAMAEDSVVVDLQNR